MPKGQFTSLEISGFFFPWLSHACKRLISYTSWWQYGRVANFIVCGWHITGTRPHDFTDRKSRASPSANAPDPWSSGTRGKGVWVYFSTSELEKKGCVTTRWRLKCVPFVPAAFSRSPFHHQLMFWCLIYCFLGFSQRDVWFITRLFVYTTFPRRAWMAKVAKMLPPACSCTICHLASTVSVRGPQILVLKVNGVEIHKNPKLYCKSMSVYSAILHSLSEESSLLKTDEVPSVKGPLCRTKRHRVAGKHSTHKYAKRCLASFKFWPLCFINQGLQNKTEASNFHVHFICFDRIFFFKKKAVACVQYKAIYCAVLLFPDTRPYTTSLWGNICSININVSLKLCLDLLLSQLHAGPLMLSMQNTFCLFHFGLWTTRESVWSFHLKFRSTSSFSVVFALFLKAVLLMRAWWRAWWRWCSTRRRSLARRRWQGSRRSWRHKEQVDVGRRRVGGQRGGAGRRRRRGKGGELRGRRRGQVGRAAVGHGVDGRGIVVDGVAGRRVGLTAGEVDALAL